MITLTCEPNFVSPYVFSVFLTLTEKKLAFDLRPVDSSRGDTRVAEYLERTITGRVPSLAHDDFAIAESSAIVEYLDETFPEVAVLPRGLRERARARQLMSWLRSDDTAKIREERPSTTIFVEPVRKPLSDSASSAVTKLVEVAERLIPADGTFLFGAWSVVDSELAFMLQRLVASGDAVPERVRVWAQAQWARPSVKAWIALERPARV